MQRCAISGGHRITQHRNRHTVGRVQDDAQTRRDAYQRHGERGFELRAQARLLRDRAARELRNPDEDDASQRGQ